MDIILAIGSIVAVVWAAALFRYRHHFKLSPFVVGGTLTLLVGTVFGHSFFNTNVGPIPITLDRLLLGAVVAVFGLQIIRRKERLRSLDRTDLMVLMFLGILTVSTLTHDWKFRDSMPLSQLLFFNFLPICLYFVVKNAKLAERDLYFVFISLAVFCVYLSLTGFAETREWNWAIYPSYISDPTVTEFLGRGRGPLHNPVANGMLIVVGCCSAMFMMAQWRDRGFLCVVAAGVAIIGVLGAYSTLTRIIWFSLAACIFLLTWAPLPKRAKQIYSGVGVMAAMLVVVVASSGALNSFKRDKHVSPHEMSKSAGLRVVFFVIAKDMFMDQPVFGHGFGQYRQAKRPYLNEMTEGNVETALGRSYIQHNIVLSFLTETGLVGAIALLAMLGTFAWIGWSVWFDPGQTLAFRQAGLLLLAFSAVFLITGMVQDVTVIPIANSLLFFFAGLGSNILRTRFEYAHQHAAEPAMVSSHDELQGLLNTA